MLAVFLSALDQTIVSTALPTLVRELGGAGSYGWVGSAYLLMAACECITCSRRQDLLDPQVGSSSVKLTCIERSCAPLRQIRRRVWTKTGHNVRHRNVHVRINYVWLRQKYDMARPLPRRARNRRRRNYPARSDHHQRYYIFGR